MKWTSEQTMKNLPRRRKKFKFVHQSDSLSPLLFASIIRWGTAMRYTSVEESPTSFSLPSHLIPPQLLMDFFIHSKSHKEHRRKATKINNFEIPRFKHVKECFALARGVAASRDSPKFQHVFRNIFNTTFPHVRKAISPAIKI